MNKHVIHYAGLPVGILVPRDDAFAFVAVKFPVIGLDGHRFTSVSEARRAIHAHVSRGEMIAA
jgi:hypothetical protein